MNVIYRVARKNKVQSVPSRILKPIAVPFSWTGIIAVLACPVLLCTDIFTSGFTYLGIIYVLILALLSNERRILVGLFATMAALMLIIDLRIIYGQEGSEIAVMDKVLALIALPAIAYALIRHRAAQIKTQKRRKACNIAIIPPLNERVALIGETKSVFRHICKSDAPLDEYTRELIWFVYLKSPKN